MSKGEARQLAAMILLAEAAYKAERMGVTVYPIVVEGGKEWSRDQ